MSQFNKRKNKIIVTGSEGFVGNHTVSALEKLGYKVFRYDLKTNYDIRNIKQLKEVFEENDKILHLAAIARFAEADKNPKLAFETNIEGTRNIAIIGERKNIERICYSSTGSVYMPIEQEPPITEDFPAKGNSVYGCSKYIGELYIKEHKTPYIILRYAHLFGEGKIGHGAIGGFIDRMNRGLAPILYGGQQSNDFTYIKDIVDANILALESDKINETYNIGTGQELTTEEVFNKLKDIFKYNKGFERLEQRKVDANRFVYDISKAKKLLGYNPKFTFIEGMKDWYKK